MSDPVVYQRSQFFSREQWILSLAPVLVIPAIAMVFGESFEEVAPEVSIPLSAWAVAWLAMAKLTVTVTFAEFRLAFLFGWPRKRIRRSDIRSTTPVRDPQSDARAVRSSTIWNPRRRQGVLLVLVGGKSLTVGADDPDALISALNA